LQRSLQRRTISAICDKDRKITRIDLIIVHRNLQSLRQTLVFSLLVVLLCFSTYSAYAQQPRLATFHETAQVIIDQRIQNQTSTSVAILSTSNQEILVPVDLDKKIHDMENVTAVVITNEDRCVLGVVDEACVLINISVKLTEAQSKGKEVGDLLIGDINNAFRINAKFHSVFIHTDDKVNRALETSGEISGHGTVSIVYTFPKSDASFLYETLTVLLIPNQIRESGGFLDVAKKLADDPTSAVTFSITPKGTTSLFQLQVSRDQKITDKIASIDILQYLGIEKLQRSNYFSSGFFPLNSLVQVVVLSNEPLRIANHGSQVVPTVEKDGEIYPSDLTKNGWLFDPASGNTVVAKYLFGQTNEVTKDDLRFSITNTIPPTEVSTDNSVFILIGIGAAAAVVIALYLKNIRSKN
jgi:hypothetical protein